MYFLMSLATTLLLVGLDQSLQSKGQETGCRVYLRTQTELTQCWELDVQTLLHISVE